MGTHARYTPRHAAPTSPRTGLGRLRTPMLASCGALVGVAAVAAPASAHAVDQAGSRTLSIPAVAVAERKLVHVCNRDRTTCTPAATEPAGTTAAAVHLAWSLVGSTQGAVVTMVPTDCGAGYTGTLLEVGSQGGDGTVTIRAILEQWSADGTSQTTELLNEEEGLSSTGGSEGAVVCIPT